MSLPVKRLLVGLVTAIPVVMTLLSGVMKLSGAPEIVEGLTRAGVGPYISLLGIMEIVFATLFVVPRTMKVGLLLLTAYFAGAMATDLSHGNPLVAPAVLLTLVWVAAFLRDSSIFLPTPPPTAA